MAGLLQVSEEARLFAHAEELLNRAGGGEITATAFLTPQMQRRLATYLSHAADSFIFMGGYEMAERRRMVCLPDYVKEADDALRADLLADFCAEKLCAVGVRGSGYLPLSHRDFLGAVLNLGIKREAVGDLCVVGPHEAVLFCDGLMADFLAEHLTRVGGDAVSVAVTAVSADFDGGRRFAPVSDTVASPRADAVVAALCNLSRDKARALFAAGLVEINYEMADKPDREVTADAVVTVRGHGKFIVRSVADKTKKGRYRLLADRYL